jgi:hypothetical protein
MSQNDKLKVILQDVILSFPNIARPQKQTKEQIEKGQKPKYSAAIVLTKGHPQLAEIEAAVIAAAVAEWGETMALPNGQRVPMADAFKPEYGLLRGPFRTDALKKGYPVGSVYFNARSERKPQVVYRHKGADGRPVEVPADLIEETFYSGSHANVSVRAFTYDNNGKGVGIALNNLQFHSDGARLDNQVAAQDEFTADLNEAAPDLSDLK